MTLTWFLSFLKPRHPYNYNNIDYTSSSKSCKKNVGISLNWTSSRRRRVSWEKGYIYCPLIIELRVLTKQKEITRRNSWIVRFFMGPYLPAKYLLNFLTSSICEKCVLSYWYNYCKFFSLLRFNNICIKLKCFITA